MWKKPAASQNSGPIRAVLLAALIAVIPAPPAGAQTATSTAGDVGSAASRSGYPAGGGVAVLPASGAATTATGITPATGVGGGTATGSGGGSSASGTSGSGGGGRTGTSSTGGAARSSGTGGGGAHWVLCPPTGSIGLAPLFTGTDLSCTPD
jgi:hypothetical protein